MAKKRVSPFSSAAAWHYSLGVKRGRNSMGPLAAFMDNLTAFVDNLTACRPNLHLAIMDVGRKKSHFMGPLAAFMDNLAALVDNQVRRRRSFFLRA